MPHVRLKTKGNRRGGPRGERRQANEGRDAGVAGRTKTGRLTGHPVSPRAANSTQVTPHPMLAQPMQPTGKRALLLALRSGRPSASQGCWKD